MSHTFLQPGSGDEFERNLEQEVKEGKAVSPDVVRVKAPSKLILLVYMAGLLLATTIAFLVFLIVAVGDWITWIFTSRSRQKGIRSYRNFWDKLMASYNGFAVYYTVWKFSLHTKSKLGYVEIPRVDIAGPFLRAKDKVSDVFEVLDPLEILAGIFLAAQASLAVYTVGVLLWFVVFPVTLTYVHINTGAQLPISQKVPTQPEFKPNDIQIQQQDFGPFLNVGEAGGLRKKAGVNNLALLADTGSLRFSTRWTVKPNLSTWIPSASSNVTSVSVNGPSVTFMDNRQNTFILNVDEPFVYENYTALIFRISSDGKVYQTPRSDTELVPTSSVPSSAPANPKLSR